MGRLSFDTQFLSSNLNGILKRVGKVKNDIHHQEF